ncbi:MAG: shikimate kinase [Candidatus Hadarchaeales archaeon]
MTSLSGVGFACASATVVNAMSTGKGAAFGVDLWLEARVKLSSSFRGVKGRVVGMKESPRLIELCVKEVLKKFGADNLGARVITYSDIPVAVGLSSSSAAANAAVLATLMALGEKLEPQEVLEIGVKVAIESGVTVTGAFDDAAASLLACGVITDNEERRILKTFEVDPSLKVAIHIPRGKKLYSGSLRGMDFSSIAEGIEKVHQMALEGEIWTAMTLNGILYASVLKHDLAPTFLALSSGVSAAGLTGKGPATVAIGTPEKIAEVAKKWKSLGGRIIITSPARRWISDEIAGNR